jgi:hypothetical protein
MEVDSHGKIGWAAVNKRLVPSPSPRAPRTSPATARATDRAGLPPAWIEAASSQPIVAARIAALRRALGTD